MSSKKRNRAPKDKTIFVPKQKDEGIGPFKVVATVFGCYTWGKKAGHTNPKEFARLTVHGDTFKKAVAKLSIQYDEKGKIIPGSAFYRIEEVVDEGRQAINIYSTPDVEVPDVGELVVVGRGIAPVVNEMIAEGVL